MAENQQTTLFRKKTMDRIASPEQLTDYLRVTSPGVWLILCAVVLLLVGLFVWSAVGTLESSTDARALVRDHTADVVLTGTGTLEAGMPLRIEGQEFVIASVEEDDYGRTVGRAEVALPDGTYDAQVVTEELRPIDFLLESK